MRAITQLFKDLKCFIGIHDFKLKYELKSRGKKVFTCKNCGRPFTYYEPQ